MTGPDSIKAAFVLSAIALAMMFSAFKRFLRARKLEDIPTCPIASSPAGLVESQGVAWPSKKLFDCDGVHTAYLELYLEERVRRGKHSEWVVREKFVTDWPDFYFCVLDASGLAKVFPLKADLNIREMNRSWSRLTQTQRENVLEMLPTKPSGIFTTSGFLGFFLGSTWRVREKKILAGNKVLVQGNFVPYSNPEEMHDAAVTFLMRILGGFLNPKNRKTLPFDFDRNGRVDASEMQRGLCGAYRVALGKRDGADNFAKEHCHKIVGEYTNHDVHQLFIADDFEEGVLAKIGSWNLLLFVVGALCLGGALYLVLQ